MSGALTVNDDLEHRNHVSIDDWLNGRRPVHLSTNAGSDEIAFQSWRRFKEAFAPELIAQAYEETSSALGRKVTSCIDPFGGSGTTALASQFLGVTPTTIEVNPYLADLIEAKLASYDIDRLIHDFEAVIADAPLATTVEFEGAADTFIEPGRNGRYLFSYQVAERLVTLRERISKVRNLTNRRLMRALLGSISLEVSNAVVSGKGRRYRRNWQTRQSPPEAVFQRFSEAMVQAIYELRRFENRKSKKYTLIRGDARSAKLGDSTFDMAVFSPPYPNSFDYTDVYNVELWVCGYLKSQRDNRRLRMSTLRSHVQIARNFEAADMVSPTLARVVKELEEVQNTLWNHRIPSMVSAYFHDMCLIMKTLKQHIISDGRMYMVVGDSRYAGVQVPVGNILCELASQMGLKLIAEEPFRSMRASPQQGGRAELLETLVTLRRV